MNMPVVNIAAYISDWIKVIDTTSPKKGLAIE